MAYGNYRNWQLPRLTSYKDASLFEAGVKPIRGDANGTKPLGTRKQKWFNIRREEQTQDIVLRAHNTDVIRFKSNGDVVINNGGWVSSTTHDFLTEVLGLYVRTFDSKAWATCYFQPDGFINAEPTHGQFVLPNNTDVTITRYLNSWLTKHMQGPSTHRVNREKANILRKSYVPFKRYMEGLIKLRAEAREYTTWRGNVMQQRVITFTTEELKDVPVLGQHFHPRDDDTAQALGAMMRSGDAAECYKAFVAIARSSYDGQRHYRPWGSKDFLVDPQSMRDYFKKLVLFIHKHDVLEKTPGDVSKAKRDPFGKWF
jgi:hypothetical protein